MTENGASGTWSGSERNGAPRRCGDRFAVALVGDEQLQHAGELAELGRARERLLVLERVHEPHAAVVDEGVRRPLERVVADPGQPQRMFG